MPNIRNKEIIDTILNTNKRMSDANIMKKINYLSLTDKVFYDSKIMTNFTIAEKISVFEKCKCLSNLI